MLRFDPSPEVGSPTRKPDLDSWGIKREVGDLLLSDANSFLVAMLFNYQWPYPKACEAPYELRKRLGHLDVIRLAKMTPNELMPFVRGDKPGASLHRFPSEVSKRIIAASLKLLAQYHGLATNIWVNGTSASEVIARLSDFKGISQKISNMMAVMLVRDFGVQLTGWDKIDIAVDRHVARVFLRTGLVPRQDGNYSVSEVRDEVIAAARTALPMYPGHLDGAAFAIGLDWCTAEEAYCDWEEKPCPLSSSCR